MTDYLDKVASLKPDARRIICDKATEPSHHETVLKEGSYLCRRCGLALFRAKSQFNSGCGWPGFDEAVDKTVLQQSDADGFRTEILCQRCHAHLGHVFEGEWLTPRNLRFCVNSLSLDYVTDNNVLDSEEAIVAGGCFWGVDYLLRQLDGALNVESGYIGGHLKEPGYEQVCRGDSGHYEAVRVVFDCSKTDYKTVIKRFFEIHDPTQRSGQGPDLGQQYQSAVFYFNNAQFKIGQELIGQLQEKGYSIATRLLPVSIFWRAEDYHQNYYVKNGKTPYCHRAVPRFDGV